MGAMQAQPKEFSALAVFTAEPFFTGLNNQRMCLVGLFELARQRGAQVRMLPQLLDHIPREEPQQALIDPFDLFDRDRFQAVAGPMLAPAPGGEEPELIAMGDCFAAGGSALKLGREGSFAIELMLALTAAPPLQACATRLASWLGSVAQAGRDGLVALQLRIERDWRLYLQRKNVWSRTDPRKEFLTVDPADIFRKLRATPGFERTSAIWACCDEDDLVETKQELKAIASGFGLELLFKSDLPDEIVLPASPIMRSMVDFTVCRMLPCYVGTTRSTFSNMQANTSRWQGDRNEHWIYSNPEPAMRKRQG
jgi:hypothetical protein